MSRIATHFAALQARGRKALIPYVTAGDPYADATADIMVAMAKDPDCKVVMTLSGAMTIAKMGKVIQKMIDEGLVHAVVSTGALMAHGLSEAIGLTHYRHNPDVSDEELFDKGYNRVYDTLEMEANLNHVEEFSTKAMELLGPEKELSSEVI